MPAGANVQGTNQCHRAANPFPFEEVHPSFHTIPDYRAALCFFTLGYPKLKDILNLEDWSKNWSSALKISVRKPAGIGSSAMIPLLSLLYNIYRTGYGNEVSQCFKPLRRFRLAA